MCIRNRQILGNRRKNFSCVTFHVEDNILTIIYESVKGSLGSIDIFSQAFVEISGVTEI